jgi:hypothetical protein
MNATDLMNRKTIGAVLLSAAGVAGAIGVAGAQIASGFLRGSVHAALITSRTTGVIPPGPADASPHWLVFVLVALLGLSGLYFLFGQSKSE